jgi:hypothetical protein
MPEIQPTGANPLQKYFRQPKIYLTLPSGGKFYPEGTLEVLENNEYPVYPMTARDELTMKTPDALLNGQATVDMIQSCVPNIKDAWRIPSLDLDAILIAIRIATYGETMDLNIKTPVTGEEKTYTVDLRVMLDDIISKQFSDTFDMNGLRIHIRPLSYREFTDTSLKTFEEQRIFSLVNNQEIPDEEKLQRFNQSFKKLTDITVSTLRNSIWKIETEDGVVDNPAFIDEFVSNAEKGLFKALTDHLDVQREQFKIKPIVLDATDEEIEKGVPETYEIPVTFDQANFFG